MQIQFPTICCAVHFVPWRLLVCMAVKMAFGMIVLSPFREYELRSDVPTILDILKKQGYITGDVRKWHLEKPRPVFDKQGSYVGEGAEGEDVSFRMGRRRITWIARTH